MKKFFAAAILLSLSLVLSARGPVGVDGKATDCRRWAASAFAAGKLPPFSFDLDGAPSASFIRGWKFSKGATVSAGPGETVTPYIWTDRRSGLQVECLLSLYDDADAAEWVLKFRNTSGRNSGVISNLKVLDLVQKGEGEWEFCSIKGCATAKDDYLPVTVTLAPGQEMKTVCDGGRSTSQVFPYFNVRTPQGGVIYTVGWSGMWNWSVKENDDARGCAVTLGLETLEAYLEPGEEIRSPRAAMLPWSGSDRMDGQNLWRRHMLAHHTPRNSKGERCDVPVSFCTAYVGPVCHDQYSCISEKVALAIQDMLHMFKIPYDNFWIDAGWYEGADTARGGGWTLHVGNWEVDKDRFPAGLKPVSDEAHRQGKTFTLWFEPERATKNSSWSPDDTKWYIEHPDYFIDINDQFGWMMLDLARDEVLDFLCKEISGLIRDNGVDIYRQDFNFPPNQYWVTKDTDGRKGIEEIRYVTNLYRFLDYLKEEFPDIVIDNCSSGGRRLDLELMSRSLPFWRTDYDRGEPTGAQIHGYGLSQWLPEHSAVVFKPGIYTSRSAMGAGVVLAWNLFGENIDLDRCRADAAEIKKVSSYYLEDFYPLSGYDNLLEDDIWLAYQLNRPSDGTGYIVAFRRPASADPTYTVRLRGLDPQATYELLNEDTQERISVPGSTLLAGYTLTLPTPESSLLLHYRLK